MQSSQFDNLRTTMPAQPVRHVTPTERQTAIDQLARAVGEHALRQAEIDQRMATRLIELRDELSAAKEEIRSLRAQVETLIQGLARARPRPHAIDSRVASCAASIRGRPQKSID
jgi:plasmid stabilization system protein ParE